MEAIGVLVSTKKTQLTLPDNTVLPVDVDKWTFSGGTPPEVDDDNTTAIIIGVVVGLLVIIIIVVVVVLVCKCQKEQKVNFHQLS